MRTRKKIDELYRERLSHVETTPPLDIWQNISDRLPEKKKKRILPIWYAMAGTAAAIALFFLIFSKGTQGSSPYNKIAISTPQQNVNLKFDPTSPAYREYMNTSSAILEAAALATRFELLEQELQVNRMQTDREPSKDHTSAKIRQGRLAERSPEQNRKDLIIIENPDKTAPATLAHLEQPLQAQIPENDKIADASSGVVEKEAQNTIGKKTLAINAETGQKLQDEKLKEEVSERSDHSRRFSITPTAAAVYFDNFGSGNLLDDQFSNRESGGEISMSYGVNLAYQVTEKFKLRSGISKIKLTYTTRAVDYTSALNSQAINLDPQESNTFPTDPNNAFSPVGSLNQNMGFLEVPLEIEYLILNKKTGINLIGGLSTLFLETNGVALNSSQFSANLGEANNINDLSFSVNVGVGLHYKITPLFQFNLEPILKYHINTFSNTSNLHSYYFGIYSGLSFKF